MLTTDEVRRGRVERAQKWAEAWLAEGKSPLPVEDLEGQFAYGALAPFGLFHGQEVRYYQTACCQGGSWVADVEVNGVGLRVIRDFGHTGSRWDEGWVGVFVAPTDEACHTCGGKGWHGKVHWGCKECGGAGSHALRRLYLSGLYATVLRSSTRRLAEGKSLDPLRRIIDRRDDDTRQVGLAAIAAAEAAAAT